MNIQMYMDIGKIVALHQRKMDFRFHYLNNVKKAEKGVEDAQRGVMAFGCYDDCGSFYYEQKANADGVVIGVHKMKEQVMRLDKYVKMCIHRFKENYPTEEAKNLLASELKKGIHETRIYLVNKAEANHSKEMKKAWNIR